MPDISACDYIDCPIRETCYRFTATPSVMQTYLILDREDYIDGDCDMYWDDRPIMFDV